ncbi:MAG: class I SAM-dependent DNA methyltransferase [Caulobacter segnis]|uniref:site-specific DNA-methyltransferase (adenine-specific) n=2 Tax=Caulobacter segnis TaxID=88688 RepID=A0A2W5WK73_9CAUL|nr:MAG: class I SAM-dependent DNA methyltransferase [Caulobacter segnis]
MTVDEFIARWTQREGGAERANYQMFLSELCDVLGVDRPEPSGADRDRNDYVFERAVRSTTLDGASAKRIDLYKRGCFLLEAKQSHARGGDKAAPEQLALGLATAPEAVQPEQLGRRAAVRNFDVLMRKAFNQALDYVHLLPTDHAAPPFLIVADVGHCLEIYADFSGTGRGYAYFPDRKGYRVYLNELRDPKVRERLQKIWSDPHSLDPAREAARVTREIAERLAAVSKALEKSHPAEEVALFLMRSIFTMFAEDVELLPKGAFTHLLEECLEAPASFAPLLKELWQKMDDPDPERRFYSAFKVHLRYFNGGLFANPRAFPLGKEEIGELLAAARRDWRQVEPAIFGTLVEQALDPAERRRLGAHYTPRAYVERLVNVTVMEPLRDDWRAARTKAEALSDQGDLVGARAAVKAFHHQLCATRVLDPACGTANFLYVSLELMKVLEAEVLETLAQLGEPETLGFETVDPHQFLGIELNPRAAAIAELVLWLGYLQQHYRSRDGHPSEPILRAFHNIENRDAVLTWDGYPVPAVVEKDGQRVETYPNARRPEWPEVDFIVGNPPFIGGSTLRARLGDGYVEALWGVNKAMNDSADFVMYWWDRAAEILARKKTILRRFGFVTTNSITQVFQRRVMERHLNGKPPISLIFAIGDHPWTKAGRESAAVRIAMTAAARGKLDGVAWEVATETGLDTDEPFLTFTEKRGKVNSDLTVGVDVTRARALLANEGVCSPGVKLHGSGFIVTQAEAQLLGLGQRPGLEKHIRLYRNGRDLTARPRGVMVIDLFGLSSDAVRRDYPEVYQHLLEAVKSEREAQAARSPTKDAIAYRDLWWVFGKPRSDLRHALEGLDRYIATVETTKHRIFQFLPIDITADNMLIVTASSDAWHLAVLSSVIHTTWAPVLGGWLGFGNDPRYSKSRCFDPFPFPDPSEEIKARLRALGEELDATRKTVLAENDDLTLTGLYNLLEKVRAGAALTPVEQDQKTRGRVLILKELHDQIDAATADAYGWPRDLTDEQILERLVALNAERAREEAAGHVRWLRPDYQIPRFAKGAAAKSGELDLGEAAAVEESDEALDFPKDAADRPPAVLAALEAAGQPLDVTGLTKRFKKGGKRIEQAVIKALASLVRWGHVTALPDGRYVGRSQRKEAA